MPSFFFKMKNPLQAHSAKTNIVTLTTTHFAEGACKYQNQQHQKVSKAHLQL
jgi:hypothetical protein